MYPVSEAFLAALAAPSMRVAVRVQTTGGVTLRVLGGSVTMDGRRGICRSCELELIPTATLSAMDVYLLAMNPATEIRIERGLIVDGSPEYVPLGVFSADEASVKLTAAGTVRYSGSDRSTKVSRAHFTDPYKVASGTTLAAAGATLLVDRYPLMPCDFSGVSGTIGANLVFQAGGDSDPWDHALSMFADFGYFLHIDGDGVARATAIPDPVTAPLVYEFRAGDATRITDAELRGTLQQTYNGVIASGEGSGVATPVRAEVWDEDPDSPTYVGSAMGKVPRFYSSPLLTTASACAQAARGILAKAKGITEQLSFPAVVNPALTPLDVVGVPLGGYTSAVAIDALTVPLKASDPMPVTARETRRTA